MTRLPVGKSGQKKDEAKNRPNKGKRAEFRSMQTVPQALILVLVTLLIIAAVNDVRRYLIPNWISLAILALFPLYVLAAHFFGTGEAEVRWLASLGVAAIVFALLVVLFAFGAFGGGDVKLIGATSLWAGPELIATFIMVTALTGGVLAIVYLIAGKYGLLQGSVAAEEIQSPAEDLPPVQKPGNAAMSIPYGVAIACGGIFISGKQIINHFSQ